MINEEDVERALDYLRDTAEEYAQHRAAERFYDAALKRIEAQEFVSQETGAVEAKRMKARASDAYGECLENYRESKYQAELLAALRDAAQHKISAYQTMAKAQRGGF